jgi:hypothetical protein
MILATARDRCMTTSQGSRFHSRMSRWVLTGLSAAECACLPKLPNLTPVRWVHCMRRRIPPQRGEDTSLSFANSSIHKVLPAFPATLYDNLAVSTGNLSQVPERPIGFADRPRDRGALRKDVIGWCWNQRRGVVPLTSWDRCYWEPEKLSIKITVTHFVTITDARLST